MSTLTTTSAGDARGKVCPWCHARAKNASLRGFTCPSCRKQVSDPETVIIPGLGEVERYECECGQEFLAPKFITPNPGTAGANNASGNQTTADPSSQFKRLGVRAFRCTSSRCGKLFYIAPPLSVAKLQGYSAVRRELQLRRLFGN